MDDLTLELEITKIEKYLVKQGRVDFIQEMRKSDSSQLEDKLLNLAKHIQEIQTTMDSDEELKNAKDKVKLLRQPYNDQTKMNKKLARFVHLLMKERGDI